MSAKLFRIAAAFALAALCALSAAAADAKKPQKPIKFRNAFEAPFELTGFPWRGPNGELRRLPMSITAKDLKSGSVPRTHVWQSAGGEVRFRTNSDRVVLRAELYYVQDMSHMTRVASSGFVFFTDRRNGRDKFQRAAGISAAEAMKGKGPDGSGKYLYTMPLNSGGKFRSVSIFMPLYSGVRKMEIGIEEGTEILPPLPRAIRKPICFYGPSYTQGCSASHPGSVHPAMIARTLDAPHINLGFSDGARGEPCVAEAIATLDMAAFVMEYDYNAKSVKELDKTHEAFFKIVRAAQPKLPIILVSGPRDGKLKDARLRRDIVKRTYDNAVKAGDKHVYFIDGTRHYDQKGLPAIPRGLTTVDGSHPTDLGFYLIYHRMLPVVKQAIAEDERDR